MHRKRRGSLFRSRAPTKTRLVSRQRSNRRVIRLKLSHRSRCILLLVGLSICGAKPSLAQSVTTSPGNSVGQSAPATSGGSQFGGSVPGKLVPGVMPLSLQEAIDLGLKQNLGVLLSSADIQSARGQRWQQLSALLPQASAAPYVSASKLNLA